MLPIKDDVPTRNTPWVTYLLLVVNIAVFLWMINLPDAQQLRLVETYGVVPARLVHDPTHYWVTLLTAQFIHGGWLHIGGNMLVLWIFGNNVEDRLGAFKFLLFYLVCGVVAGLAQVASDPNSSLPGIGASGAIAGVMAAYLIWYPGARVVTLIPILILPWLVRLPALVVIVLWFALQLWEGIAELNQPALAAAGGVAFWAHVGGFICGLILGPLLAATGGEPGRPSRVRA